MCSAEAVTPASADEQGRNRSRANQKGHIGRQRVRILKRHVTDKRHEMHSTCANELGWNDEDRNGRFDLMHSLHAARGAAFNSLAEDTLILLWGY